VFSSSLSRSCHIIPRCRKAFLIAGRFSSGQGCILFSPNRLGERRGFNPQSSFMWAIQHNLIENPSLIFTHSCICAYVAIFHVPIRYGQRTSCAADGAGAAGCDGDTGGAVGGKRYEGSKNALRVILVVEIVVSYEKSKTEKPH